MGVREEVLKRLEGSRGAAVSGAELAKELEVSRNAVWKAVKALREAGYLISASPDGYCLNAGSDLLSAAGIGQFLKARDFYAITWVEEVDSTNLALKKMAAGGAQEGRVLVANAQSAGRGRMGRRFHSPPGTGAYFSVLLRPKMDAREAQGLTTIAAVAVAEAIEEVAGREAKIKWVNDVLVDGKKVCGILTEASLDMETGHVEYAVVGIGLNVRPGGIPAELQDIAGTVFEKDAPGAARSRLLASVLDRFYGYYQRIREKAWLAGYRERSAVLGRTVQVIPARGDQGARRALALEIDDDFALLVRYEDGSEEKLSSGEVSTRL